MLAAKFDFFVSIIRSLSEELKVKGINGKEGIQKRSAWGSGT